VIPCLRICKTGSWHVTNFIIIIFLCYYGNHHFSAESVNLLWFLVRFSVVSFGLYLVVTWNYDVQYRFQTVPDWDIQRKSNFVLTLMYFQNSPVECVFACEHNSTMEVVSLVINHSILTDSAIWPTSSHILSLPSGKLTMSLYKIPLYCSVSCQISHISDYAFVDLLMVTSAVLKCSECIRTV